jgi:hypothetical protein
MAALSYDVATDGFAMASGVVAESERLVLADVLGTPRGAGGRGLLAVPAVRALTSSEAMSRLITPILGTKSLPVRAIYFDKSKASNWLVPWHQDVTIAVARKVEAAGFGPWSVKDGITHVQPPDALLAQMLTVRLHLDDCDASNGALRVIPGSHKNGRLGPDQIAKARASAAEVVCEARAGDVLLMRPLLLHASSKSISDRRRRILHIDYCSAELPFGMAWHDSA